MTKYNFDYKQKREPLILDYTLLQMLFKTNNPTKLITTFIFVYYYRKFWDKNPTVLDLARILNCSLIESQKRLKQLRFWLKNVTESNELGKTKRVPLGLPSQNLLAHAHARTREARPKKKILYIIMFPRYFRKDKSFCQAWSNWINEKRRTKGKLSKRAATMQRNKLVGQDIDTAIAMIETAIECGWATVYPPRNKGKGAIVKKHKINVSTQTLKGD